MNQPQIYSVEVLTWTKDRYVCMQQISLGLRDKFLTWMDEHGDVRLHTKNLCQPT